MPLVRRPNGGIIMKEITITFTADEFVELAKQLYLCSFLTIGFQGFCF
jgi:hypothetical protein